MKIFFKFLLVFVVVGTCVLGMSQEKPGESEKPGKTGSVFTSEAEKISYSIGYDMGKRFKEHAADIDYDILFMGLKDSMKGQPSLISPKEFEKYMGLFFKAIESRVKAKRKTWGEKNKVEGEAFLKENKEKEGVITCKSGLQYKILRPGKGEKPGPDDSVKIHYRGTLIDGTEFHDSYSKGEPVTFPIMKTFTGWQEALRMMKKGAKWRVFLPPELAMGEEGLGDAVGPNAVIIFDIELLDFFPTPETEPHKGTFNPRKKKKEDVVEK